MKFVNSKLQGLRLKLRRNRLVLRLLLEAAMAVMFTGCGLNSQLQTTEFILDVPFSNELNTQFHHR